MPQRILLVDDDKDLVYLIKVALEADGFEVITAADGEQALSLIRTSVPDLMIVDLTMPVMSGWHFSLKVRKDPRYKTTPIIVLSGLLEREAKPEEYEICTTYVPKPFDIHQLIVKIKDLLKQS